MTITKNEKSKLAAKRFKRFVLAAVVAVMASQITLTICLGPARLPAESSAITAWATGALASYLMSRWAWERKGRPHVLKEMLPFWIIAACVAIVLTLTTKYANEYALSIGLSHTARVLFVDMAYFLANCVTFMTRFVIFHFFLFADKQASKPEAITHST